MLYCVNLLECLFEYKIRHSFPVDSIVVSIADLVLGTRFISGQKALLSILE